MAVNPRQSGSTGVDVNGTSVKPDVKAIMGEIRDRTRGDIDSNKDARAKFQHARADFDTSSAHKAGELLNSEELRYLNHHHAYSLHSRLSVDKLSSHRGGFVGRLILKIKRKLAAILWDSILKDYFHEEREYQANLVRYLNQVSKYVDSRDAANFWELIRKIDVDVTKALDRIERINDEQSASIRSSERRVNDALDGSLDELRRGLAELRTVAMQHDSKLSVVESVASGIEGVLARVSRAQSKAPAELHGDDIKADASYLMLENRFRGSEAEIAKRLAIYPTYFAGATAPVLEIGSGRGELQVLLRDGKIPSYGIDMDQAMVECANEKGVDTRAGDGIAHLRSLPPRSIGGVIAVQVVEHLTWTQLRDLFTLCREKVVPGGRIIFETINPRSLLALSSNYFRDPTHVWPLHPDTLSYEMTLCGLKVVEVRELSPVAKEAELRPIPVEEYMTPRWVHAIETMNRNFEQLNSLLYGNQDYCVVAES